MTTNSVLRSCSMLLAIGLVHGARGNEMAQATLTSTPLSQTSWRYDITLNDPGTTNLGTFWFAWTPGEDFLPTSPTNIVSPTSWTANVTHVGASDGFAIQWIAGQGAALMPGSSLSGFQFDSTASPSIIDGSSPFFPTTPVLVSFVYSGAPFSDSGFRFQVQDAGPAAATPEPATFAMAGSLLAAAALSAFRGRAQAR